MTIEVHLAPEDPRLTDLKRAIIDKLKRVIPGIEVRYIARTRTGLFEQADSQYGEVWYQVGSHRTMSRSSTPEIVLPQIYEAAAITPPSIAPDSYPGYPLVRRPRYAAAIFFILWPLSLLGAYLIRKFIRRDRHA
jgi:hypothetical protein